MTQIRQIIADKIRVNPPNPHHQRSNLRSNYSAFGSVKKKEYPYFSNTSFN